MWWSCGRVHWVLSMMSVRWGRRPLWYPWSRWVCLRRVCWCESHCQIEGLLFEFTPILTWHSACEFQHPLEEAYPLLFSRVLYYSSWAAHQMACRLLHYIHDLVQLGWRFLFIAFCSLFSSILGSSRGHGIVHNWYFCRRLFPWARAAFVPMIIGLRFVVGVIIRLMLCWGSRSSTYCPTTSNGFMTTFVKGFQIWEVCQLPLLASC